MTKHEMMIPTEVFPGFSVLKWKAETQARIYEETKDMTTEEWLEYLRQAGERAEQRRAKKEKSVVQTR